MNQHRYISLIRQDRQASKLWDQLSAESKSRFLSIVREDDNLRAVLTELVEIQEGK